MTNEEQQAQAQRLSPALTKMIAAGLPVSKAIFHQAVANGNGQSENNFSEYSANASRRVTMWWTMAGLVCFHVGNYFIVPHSNVVYANLK